MGHLRAGIVWLEVPCVDEALLCSVLIMLNVTMWSDMTAQNGNESQQSELVTGEVALSETKEIL